MHAWHYRMTLMHTMQDYGWMHIAMVTGESLYIAV